MEYLLRCYVLGLGVAVKAPRPGRDGLRQAVSQRLFELEARDVIRAIGQLDDQLAAASSPALLGLPDVGVELGGRVVRQATGPRRHGLLDVVNRRAAVTGDLLRLGIAGGEDVQPLIA